MGAFTGLWASDLKGQVKRRKKETANQQNPLRTVLSLWLAVII